MGCRQSRRADGREELQGDALITGSASSEPLLAKGQDSSRSHQLVVKLDSGLKKLGIDAGIFANPAYSKNLRLSLTISFVTCIFFIPIVFKDPVGHSMFPEKCNADDFSCNQLLNLKDLWPNVVQLMFFTVYVDLGNTVQLAWQGVIGTIVVAINRSLMATIFPLGAKCKTVGTKNIFGFEDSENNYGLRMACMEFEDETYAHFWWVAWLDVLIVIALILGSNAETNTMKFALSWHVYFMMSCMSPDGHDTDFAVSITTVVAVTLAIICMIHPKFSLSYEIGAKMNSYSDDLRKVLASKGSVGDFMQQSARLTHVVRSAVRNDMEQRVKDLLDSFEVFAPMHASTWWEELISIGMLKEIKKSRRSLWVFKETLGNSIRTALLVLHKSVLAEEDSHYIELQESPANLKRTVLASLSQRSLFTEPIREMNAAVCDCVDCIIKRCENTDPSKEELDDGFLELQGKAERINRAKDLLHKKAHEEGLFLVDDGRDWSSSFKIFGDHHIPRDLSKLHNNFLIYNYACLAIAYQASRWPERWKQKITEAQKDPASAHTLKQLPRALFRVITHDIIWEGGLATWGDFSPDKKPWTSCFQKKFSNGQCWCPFWVRIWHDPEKRSFVLTNIITIFLAYVLGNIFKGSVWVSYDDSMAANLGILISRQGHSPIHKNLKRLLGIVLGKVIPILLLSFVVLFQTADEGPEGGLEACVHLFMVFLYMAFFSNIYYTSAYWSYVGCLVAGFGCYSFVGHSWSPQMFANRYKEIGRVTFAIALQFTIDMIDMAVCKSFPRDKVVANLEKITCVETESGDDELNLVKIFEECLNFDSNSDLSTTVAKLSRVQSVIAKQRAVAEDCQENAVLLSTWRGPFMWETHNEILVWIERLKVQLDIYLLVRVNAGRKRKGAISESALFKSEASRSEIARIEWNVKQSLEVAFTRVLTLFQLYGTLPFKQSLEEMPKLRNFDNGQINTDSFTLTREAADTQSLPLCVARRTLRDMQKIIGNIDRACFTSGRLKTDFGG